MAGHDRFNTGLQEVAEGIVGARAIARGYAEADNGSDGEDAHIRLLLAQVRRRYGRDEAFLDWLGRWEHRWKKLDARADRCALQGAEETADVLADALGHLERAQRPALALVA